ncbi:glycosyltransferase family 8 protein [Thermocoleostomius sinensis]|uniref:Glycosyltransferase family 8 protein n=1 Tax=Thermocoleostomius sinensis A174 TaxID=2016057 RepID=A0A9E9C2U1_9CYAN|nr:glycosyltransferase family 8 protein [Thermocoleostomius sinensis]WAL58246.1 glycosyltransferase family 8 protein [Thermocoleostomius sinensis A174]
MIDIASNVIYLACAADDFYAMPLGVTICSAVSNLSKHYRVVLYVLDGGIHRVNKLKLMESLDQARVEIHWLRPSSSQIEQIYYQSKNSYPISAYLRLLLPEILPRQVEKVIYLDTDVIVKGDLKELWEIEVENYALLAVQDAVHRFLHQAQHLKHLDLTAMGISAEHKYLNSGVLVINLQRWRTDRIANQVIDFLAHHPELPYPDQDGINLILAGEWKELHPLWNQVHVLHLFSAWHESPYSQDWFDEAVKHPAIIHFTGRPKPWISNCTHPQKGAFLHYLSMTAWAGTTTTKWNYLEQLLRRSIRRLMRGVKNWMWRFTQLANAEH